MLNDVLDLSDSGVAKKSACSDLEKQNDVLESLTQASVQTKFMNGICKGLPPAPCY